MFGVAISEENRRGYSSGVDDNAPITDSLQSRHSLEEPHEMSSSPPDDATVACRSGQKRRLSRVAADDDMEEIIDVDALHSPSSPLPTTPVSKCRTVGGPSHAASSAMQSTLVHLGQVEGSQRGSLHQVTMSAATPDVASFKAARTVGEVHSVIVGLVQTKAAFLTSIMQQMHQTYVNTPEDIITACQYDEYYYFITYCVRRKSIGHLYVGHNYGPATNSTDLMYKRLHQHESHHAKRVREMPRPLDRDDFGVWLDSLDSPARDHPDVDTFVAFEAPKEMYGFEAGLRATVEVEALLHNLAKTAGLTFNKYGIAAVHLVPRASYVTETL